MSKNYQKPLLPSDRILQILNDDNDRLISENPEHIKIPNQSLPGQVEIIALPSTWKCLMNHYGGRNRTIDAIRVLIDETKHQGAWFHPHDHHSEHHKVNLRILTKKSESKRNEPYHFLHIQVCIDTGTHEEKTQVIII